MSARDGYLVTILLLFVALTAVRALPHQLLQQQYQQKAHQQQQQSHQQQQQIYLNEHIPQQQLPQVGNDYGPWIHISSAVLQLTPDEQKLLVLPAHEIFGSSSYPGSSTLNWPDIYGLPVPQPPATPTAHQSHISVSDNLDFELQKQRSVKSHGR